MAFAGVTASPLIACSSVYCCTKLFANAEQAGTTDTEIEQVVGALIARL